MEIRKFLRTAKPSKQYFFYNLFADAQKIPKGAWVADVASYDGMNADIFQDQRYIAVDLDCGILKKITKKCECKVQANILKLPFLDNSLDAVVSTHTLSHLPSSERLGAVEELARVVRPGGTLIFNISVFDDNHKRIDQVHFKEVLAKDFDILKAINYRGIVSRAFEASCMVWFKSKKVKGRWLTRFYMLLTLLVFGFELVTKSYKIFSEHTYYLLHKKGNSIVPSQWEISDILGCPVDKHTLHKQTDGLLCPECRKSYKVEDNIMKFVD